MQVICHECGTTEKFRTTHWRCGCGGAWEIANKPPFDSSKIKTGDFSIWRYAEMLGLDISGPKKRMGVGWTPIVPIQLDGYQIHLKLEYLSPSGSFKDRGVNTMVNQLAAMDVKMMVEDSSGNAGASVAAHAARFGIKAQIYVPAYASPKKVSQITTYGAAVVSVEGPRIEAEKAAQAAVRDETAYASHAFDPAYLAGQTTAAWEVWEQLGHKAPDWIICPVAQGGQFLGFWFGFKRLLETGLVKRLPRLIAVQAANVAPIYQAWTHGWDEIPAVVAKQSTIAEGVAIPKPSRGKRLLAALRETNGDALAIREEEITKAQQSLAHHGYYVEPTSALAIAGFRKIANKLKKTDIVLVPLTGNGLKGQPNYNRSENK